MIRTKSPYAQYSHNSHKSFPRREVGGASARILRILRILLLACFVPFHLFCAYLGRGGFEASHVSVGRKRLLYEARKHFMLPVVA